MKASKRLYIFLAVICFLGAAIVVGITLYIMIALKYDKEWWSLLWMVLVLGVCGYDAIREVQNIEKSE